MRLLFVTQALDRQDPVLGFTHEWVRAFASTCDRVIVAPLRAGDYDLPDNVEVRSMGKEKDDSVRGKLKGFSRVVGGACRDGEVDAVLAHMVPRYAVYAAPFALPRKIPLFLWYTHKGVDWSLRLAEPVVKKAFTASDLSFRLKSKKKVVVGHGIDTGAFRPRENGEAGPTHDIVVVGRIAPAKDPLVLVEALGILGKRGRTLRAVFAGDTLLDAHDEYRTRVKDRIRDLGLEEEVTLLGSVPHDQIRATYLDGQVFVTPSMTGSVDKTVLEAMACGVPPLTCNESFSEILGEQAADLMFEKGDADGLAALLEKWLDMDGAQKRGRMESLREIVVKDHDLTRLAEKITAEMEEVVSPGESA